MNLLWLLLPPQLYEQLQHPRGGARIRHSWKQPCPLQPRYYPDETPSLPQLRREGIPIATLGLMGCSYCAVDHRPRDLRRANHRVIVRRSVSMDMSMVSEGHGKPSHKAEFRITIDARSLYRSRVGDKGLGGSKLKVPPAT